MVVGQCIGCSCGLGPEAGGELGFGARSCGGVVRALRGVCGRLPLGLLLCLLFEPRLVWGGLVTLCLWLCYSGVTDSMHVQDILAMLYSILDSGEM